jgi:hypothetical protein
MTTFWTIFGAIIAANVFCTTATMLLLKNRKVAAWILKINVKWNEMLEDLIKEM